MNKRRMIIALCLMAVASSALALGGGRRLATISSPFLPRIEEKATSQPLNKFAPNAAAISPQTQQNQNGSTQQPPADVPKHIVYSILFREMAFYKQKAAEKEQKGEDAMALRKHHKEKLKLTDEQFAALDRLAAESDRETAKLDGRAKKIIGDARATHPNGKLKDGEQLPLPPAELKSLQEQRNNVILQTREQLRAAFGEAEFQHFDEFLQADITRKMQPAQIMPRPVPADPRQEQPRQ